MEGQRVYWQEQGRHVLNLQQARFERATHDYEQAARDEVHAAVAQATERSGAEVRESMGALENEAEQTWTCHQVMFLNEMNSVASVSLENPEKKFAR